VWRGGAGRDDQHRAAGDADQAVRDAAEKGRLEPPAPARTDDDQLGVLLVGQIGESFGRKTDDNAPFGVTEPVLGGDRASRTALAGRGGVEVDTQGDAFFFAFPAVPRRARGGSASATGARRRADRGPDLVCIRAPTPRTRLREGWVAAAEAVGV
jgi:hypothetical protein